MRLPLYDRSKVYVMALRPTEAVKLHALVAASGRKQLRGYMLREGVTLTDLHRELRKIRAKETLNGYAGITKPRNSGKCFKPRFDRAKSGQMGGYRTLHSHVRVKPGHWESQVAS